MYGRGQLCKLNDSSINNEIHERQRRQDAPVRRRRLLVPHQGVEGQERGTGSSHTEPGGALLVSSLRGEASSGKHSRPGFPGMLSISQSCLRKQQEGLGEHLSAPTLRTVPRSSQSQPTLPFLPCPRERRDAAPPLEPPAWPSPCCSGPAFQCLALVCQSKP